MTKNINVQKIHMGQTFTRKGEGEVTHMGSTRWFIFDGDEVVEGGWDTKWAAEWMAKMQHDPEFVVTSKPRAW